MRQGLRIAVIGLNFGSSFVPLYRAHPAVAEVAICATDERALAEVGDRHAIARRFRSLDEALRAPDIDAVHLCTPHPLHAGHAVAALEAGKHVACAVPMGMTLDELRRVIAAKERSGRSYMMMETAAYCRELLQVESLLRAGTLGRIQFVRGSHLQDLENLPESWRGFPPMLYATHALAPALKLTGSRAARVSCFGSGRFAEHPARAGFTERWGNRWPIETMIARLENGIAVEVTRSLFDTAMLSREHFDVYGDAATFLWETSAAGHQLMRLGPIVESGSRRMEQEKLHCPPRPDLLPAELAPFADGGHGGSHPHLVHEFVTAIREGREPAIGARVAADWCAPGIVAHQSALADGQCLDVPAFGGIAAVAGAA